MTILMTALGIKGVTVAIRVSCGGDVGVAVSRKLVADGVDVASTAAGAGTQRITASIKVISNRIADLRFRGELPGFMFLSPLPKKASRLHYSTELIAIQAAI